MLFSLNHVRSHVHTKTEIPVLKLCPACCMRLCFQRVDTLTHGQEMGYKGLSRFSAHAILLYIKSSPGFHKTRRMSDFLNMLLYPSRCLYPFNMPVGHGAPSPGDRHRHSSHHFMWHSVRLQHHKKLVQLAGRRSMIVSFWPQQVRWFYT